MILNSIELNKLLELKSRRTIALDIGSKKIGVAISDDTLAIATPKCIVIRTKKNAEFAEIVDIIISSNVSAIVIGYPEDSNLVRKSESIERTRKMIVEFEENLREHLERVGINILVFFIDESFSSFEARQISQSPISRGSKKEVDDIAACVILDDFIIHANSKLRGN